MPEQFLEVVRQVGSAGVGRIHGDKDCHVLVHLDLLADQLHRHVGLGAGCTLQGFL